MNDRTKGVRESGRRTDKWIKVDNRICKVGKIIVGFKNVCYNL